MGAGTAKTKRKRRGTNGANPQQRKEPRNERKAPAHEREGNPSEGKAKRGGNERTGKNDGAGARKCACLVFFFFFYILSIRVSRPRYEIDGS